ncbi:hypothetical protein BH23VER1_BH23VER1_33750 [soil metagenome]
MNRPPPHPSARRRPGRGHRTHASRDYMENWNLLLDLQVMALTLVRRDNAC